MIYKKMTPQEIKDSFLNDITHSVFDIPDYYFARLDAIGLVDTKYDSKAIDAEATDGIILFAHKKTLFLKKARWLLMEKKTLDKNQQIRYDKYSSEIELWLDIRNQFSVFKHTDELAPLLRPFFEDIRNRVLVLFSKPIMTTFLLDFLPS